MRPWPRRPLPATAPAGPPPARRRTGPLAIAAPLAAAAALALLGPGCTNDPFDPASLPNARPVARIFVTTAPGDTLNPTSYNRRTFRWSGSDQDGWVVSYYVSIETQRGVPAPWDTTARTDTTMTFATDDFGHAEATIRLACRDNRGALSDTVSQYIPLRNFPPVINYQADFDSVRWSYGAANFRFFALDLDGNETMDSELLYRLDGADTTVVRDLGEPGADPAACWVRKPFDDLENRTFAIALTGLAPAPQRTLTVQISDEAHAEARFRHAWEVKEARGPLLVVDDAGPSADLFYYPAMDELLGAGQWSVYDMTYGLPDRLWVLRETFRQFPAVLWYTSSGSSNNLKNSAAIIGEYLQPPEAGVTPGRMLLVSKPVAGSTSNLPSGFITGVLGISTTPAPAVEFNVPIGRKALGQGGLPNLTSTDGFNRQALGVQPRTGTETLFKMEYYQYDRRPPYEPIVGVRVPASNVQAYARIVTLSLQLESFNAAESREVLRRLLLEDLGVTLP